MTSSRNAEPRRSRSGVQAPLYPSSVSRSPAKGEPWASPPLPLGLLVIAVWLVWAARDGGHDPTDWGLLGVGVLLLLAVGVAFLPIPPERRRGERLLMLAALGAFVVWNFLSMLWADFPGDAWIGADKALIYATVFALLTLWPWSRDGLLAALAMFALGVAAIGAFVLARAALGADPGAYFSDDRLQSPIGYVDGTAALWTLALWPALYLAQARSLGPAVRGVSLGAAALLVQLAILGQSRGWLFVLPFAALAFVALARERLRSLLAIVLVTAVTLPMLRPLLDVYERAQAGAPIESPLDRAAWGTLVSCLVAAVAGAAWAFADRRVRVPPRIARSVAIGLVVAAAAAGVAGAVAAAVSIDHPRAWLTDRWHTFTCSYCPSAETGSRFTGTLSNDRYQDWKVAWREFVRHPVTGTGSDNYAAAYLRQRPTPLFQPRYPHSTPLRLLGELGIVGAALFAIAAGIAVRLALRQRRRLDAAAGGAVGAALTVFAYWLLHSSIDWFWEIPALAAPAFGFLALAGAADEQAERGPETRRGRGHAFAAVAGLAALLAACGALGLRWLSASYEDAGAADGRRDPAQAYSRLERAADLDPLSAQPLVVEGSIALARRDLARARSSFGEALQREPKNWYAHLQLALLDDLLGRFRPAAAEVRRARVLNPRDPGAALAERLIERKARVRPELINGFYLAEARRRFGTGR
jgi:O-Antigen ligase